MAPGTAASMVALVKLGLSYVLVAWLIRVKIDLAYPEYERLAGPFIRQYGTWRQYLFWCWLRVLPPLWPLLLPVALVASGFQMLWCLVEPWYSAAREFVVESAAWRAKYQRTRAEQLQTHWREAQAKAQAQEDEKRDAKRERARLAGALSNPQERAQ